MSKLSPDDELYMEDCILKIKDEIIAVIISKARNYQHTDILIDAADLGARMMFRELAELNHGGN